MRHNQAGSINMGRWLGIPVRLHVSFLLLALFMIFVATRGGWPDTALDIFLILTVWFACVVLHEAGHCIAVARLGGTNELLVFSPIGGISHFRDLHEPSRNLLAALGGPLASLAGALATGALLFSLEQPILPLLNPLNANALNSHDLEPENFRLTVVTLRTGLWVNWMLLMVNMLPAAPLDGGWMLHSLFSPALGVRKANTAVRRLSFAAAIGLWIVAWLVGGYTTLEAAPPWLLLTALGLIVWCYAALPPVEEELHPELDDLFGYDFSQGYTSLEHTGLEHTGEQSAPPRPGFFRQWTERRRTDRESRRIRLEQEEERQVDSILARLHEHGLASLSPSERSLLNRVSARYRSRQEG
jgi:Zn-dependent protease